MAVNQSSAYISRNLRISFGADIIDGVQDISGLTPTGTSAPIDITDLAQSDKVYATGVPDPGTVTLTGIVDPATPAYDNLVSSQENGSESELRVIIGAATTGGSYTDGSGFETASLVSTDVTAAADGSVYKFVIAATRASGLPALRAGHYIQWGTTPTYTQITGVTTASNGTVELATALSANPTIGTAAVKLWKPAFEIRRQGRVLSMTHNASVDSPFGFNLEFQMSGRGQTNKGAPAITI